MEMTETKHTDAALAHPSRRVLRGNAVLTMVLLTLVAVLGNVVAARHLDVRSDLSADGLNVISDATRRVVGRIEDRLTVRIYATQDISDGQLALRSARIRAQLDEILGLRKSVFDLQVLDPSRSSEARTSALAAGIRPTRAGRTGLGRTGVEEVWLGVVLGYRGRTEVLASPEPWRFEVQIASAFHALLSDRKIGIGWIGAPFEVPPDSENPELEQYDSTFRVMRSALSRRARLVPLVGLATGRSIPEDVDIVFLVRPGVLHEREVFAIDQFVQRGGRLVVCIDDPDYNLALPRAKIAQEDFPVSTLGRLLDSWGIRFAERHIWDDEWQSDRAARSSSGEWGLLKDPLVITVPQAGLEGSLPPVRGLDSVQFAWAHPLYPAERVAPPLGVTRVDLAWSSDTAHVTDLMPALMNHPSEIRSLRGVLRTQPGARHVIAAVFSGRFPSPWAGQEAPAAFDPMGLGSPSTNGDAPLSAEVPSQVVVFGDADWLRDPLNEGSYVQAGGGILAINLVDWLTLDEDLIGLRSRTPRLRPLRDFVAEEERALGLFDEDVYPTEAERIEADRKSDLAQRRAQRKQWLTMLAPAAAALLVLALFGALWNGLGRRRAEALGGSR